MSNSVSQMGRERDDLSRASNYSHNHSNGSTVFGFSVKYRKVARLITMSQKCIAAGPGNGLHQNMYKTYAKDRWV